MKKLRRWVSSYCCNINNSKENAKDKKEELVRKNQKHTTNMQWSFDKVAPQFFLLLFLQLHFKKRKKDSSHQSDCCCERKTLCVQIVFYICVYLWTTRMSCLWCIVNHSSLCVSLLFFHFNRSNEKKRTKKIVVVVVKGEIFLFCWNIKSEG